MPDDDTEAPRFYEEGDGKKIAREIDKMFRRDGGLPSIVIPAVENPPLDGETPTADLVEAELRAREPDVDRKLEEESRPQLLTAQEYGLDEYDYGIFREIVLATTYDLLSGTNEVTKDYLRSGIRKMISECHHRGIAKPPSVEMIISTLFEYFTRAEGLFDQKPEVSNRCGILAQTLGSLSDRDEPSVEVRRADSARQAGQTIADMNEGDKTILLGSLFSLKFKLLKGTGEVTRAQLETEINQAISIAQARGLGQTPSLYATIDNMLHFFEEAELSYDDKPEVVSRARAISTLLRSILIEHTPAEDSQLFEQQINSVKPTLFEAGQYPGSEADRRAALEMTKKVTVDLLENPADLHDLTPEVLRAHIRGLILQFKRAQITPEPSQEIVTATMSAFFSEGQHAFADKPGIPERCSLLVNMLDSLFDQTSPKQT